MLIQGKYCKKCVLRDSTPNVTFNEEGLCQKCSGEEETNHNIQRYRKSMKSVMEFERFVKAKDRAYYYDNCMVMLSGGKDSIYILRKLVKEDHLKPLAFTIDHPFESPNAQKNIDKSIKKLHVDHMTFAPDAAVFKKLMKHIFTLDTKRIVEHMGKSKQLPDQIPCMMCTSYMQILSCIMASKLGIQYILYCASPTQMQVLDLDIKIIIERFIEICGMELANEMFQGQLEELLNKDRNQIPKLVFPYASMPDYDANKIIADLKSEDIYETTPIETHCSLIAILNYFSFHKFDSYYYAADTAANVREGLHDRDDAIKSIENYRKFIDMAAEAEEITEEQIKEMKEQLRLPDYVIDKIITLKKTADELDLNLKDMI